MYSSTAVQFRLLVFGSGQAVTIDTILPSSNTRRQWLLREFSETTIPGRITLAARARKATRGLGDANLFQNSRIHMHECTNNEKNTEHLGYYFSTLQRHKRTPPPLENQHNTTVSFVEVKSLCDVTVTLFERLDWKTSCLIHTLANQLRSSHKAPEHLTLFCRWSKLVHNQKSALFGSEIRVERSYSIFCTNRHKIDIITVVCVCVFFPSILDIKFVGRTSRGHTGGRSHRIFNRPSFCGACLDFCREKDSAVPFPRRP